MHYFATAIPGIGPILRDELAAGGVTAAGVESDDRNDIVPFAAPGTFDPSGLRTSEDVYVEIGSVRETASARVLVQRLWRPSDVERALSVYASHVRPLVARMTYRAIARVRSERAFTRRALREALLWHVGRERPAWRAADVAALELWVLETRPGVFRLGARITTPAMRHRGGRAQEREGALRPTVAAAMARLAGRPGSAPLLDVTCGTGTILAEARAVGWRVAGADLDPAAARAASRNTEAPVLVADARATPFGDGAAGAVAANLPFGEQYEVEGDPRAWFDAVLAECCRVTPQRARVVLLVPGTGAFRGALRARQDLAVGRRYPVNLLGADTVLWQLRRR